MTLKMHTFIPGWPLTFLGCDLRSRWLWSNAGPRDTSGDKPRDDGPRPCDTLGDGPRDTVGDGPCDAVGDGPRDTVGDGPCDTVGDRPRDTDGDSLVDKCADCLADAIKHSNDALEQDNLSLSCSSYYCSC